MFNLQEIKISDKALIEAYLEKTENSMWCFTTIYAWSAEGKIKYDITDGCLILFFINNRNGVCCTYPMGQGDRIKACEKAISYMKCNSKAPRFILMTESMAKELNENFPGEFKIRSDRDSADYVYLTEDLINLPGKKFHQKKNHLNAFLNTYNFRYEKIDKTNIGDCTELFSRWLETQNEKTVAFAKFPTMRILENAEELGVTIGGIYVENKLVAFSAGEALTHDMAVIHLEYADTKYRGAFNIINQQFAQNEWNKFKFINREEDMGLEGLRKAKMAYRPVKMTEKYIAEYKGR